MPILLNSTTRQLVGEPLIINGMLLYHATSLAKMRNESLLSEKK